MKMEITKDRALRITYHLWKAIAEGSMTKRSALMDLLDNNLITKKEYDAIIDHNFCPCCFYAGVKTESEEDKYKENCNICPLKEFWISFYPKGHTQKGLFCAADYDGFSGTPWDKYIYGSLEEEKEAAEEIAEAAYNLLNRRNENNV